MRNLIAAAVALTAAAHAAHADNTEVPRLLALEATPLVLGATDLIAQPESKAYGGIELGTSLASATLNIGVAAIFHDTPDCARCNEAVPYLVGLTVIDAAVAVHGAYLLGKERPDPTEIKLGSVRGRVAPTMVGDGRTNAAGLGFAGRF